MTLRHLRIFVTVCNCNSITAAAEKLYLAQPSVSLAISELEKYYGIKLFDRISKKLYLTEPGTQLLDYATHIVALFDEMEKGVRNWESIGVLRIGSSVTIGSFLLPKYVKLFQRQHPNIKVRVSIFRSEHIERKVLSDQVDIALIEGTVHSSQIKSIKFKDEELVLICGKGHSLYNVDEIEIEMLKEYEFILREKGSGGRDLFDSIMLLHGIEINPIWESVGYPAIIQAVSEGLGLSVLPQLFVKNDLELGNVKQIKIKNISLKHQFYVIHHKNKYLTSTAKEFMNYFLT